MGYGAWRSSDFRTYCKNNGRSVDQKGNVAGNQTSQEMFRQKSLHPALDPKDKMRECCDGEEHPASIPVILALDVTGSMGPAAVAVARKLNEIMTNLYDEVKDVEFLVMGIGDFAYDRCPLQVSQFESDIRIAEQLDQIYFEYGGGGNGFESYTAAWYFGTRHTRLDAWDRGRKGLIITMGDEKINPYLPKDRIREVIGDRLYEDVETRQLYEEVIRKYEVYHLDVIHGWHSNAKLTSESFARVIGREHVMQVTLEEIAEKIVRIVKDFAAEREEPVEKNEAADMKIAWGAGGEEADRPEKKKRRSIWEVFAW